MFNASRMLKERKKGGRERERVGGRNKVVFFFGMPNTSENKYILFFSLVLNESTMTWDDILVDNCILNAKDVENMKILTYIKKDDEEFLRNLERILTRSPRLYVKDYKETLNEINALVAHSNLKISGYEYASKEKEEEKKENEEINLVCNIIPQTQLYSTKMAEQIIEKKKECLEIHDLYLRFRVIKLIFKVIMENVKRLIRINQNRINRGALNNLVAEYLKIISHCDIIVDYLIFNDGSPPTTSPPRPPSTPPLPSTIEAASETCSSIKPAYRKYKVNYSTLRKNIEKDLKKNPHRKR